MNSSSFILILCALIWGCTTFMMKLSADKMSPVLMQVIIGLAFFVFIPFAIWQQGGFHNMKWNMTSVILSFVAALMSIGANILMYSTLSNNKHTGSTAMLISLFPSVTLVLSAIFLHEKFSAGKILGILSMIGGVVLLTFC
jgi:drug/metabolite transporter (DMT)-like permease